MRPAAYSERPSQRKCAKMRSYKVSEMHEISGQRSICRGDCVGGYIELDRLSLIAYQINFSSSKNLHQLNVQLPKLFGSHGDQILQVMHGAQLI